MRRRWIAALAVATVLVSLGFAQVLQPPQRPTKPNLPNTIAKHGSMTGNLSAEPFSISGTVTDNKGNRLAGASVGAGSNYMTTSDSGGKYLIQGLDRSRPNYTVKISKQGYTFSPSGANIVPPKTGDVNNLNFTGTQQGKPKG